MNSSVFGLFDKPALFKNQSYFKIKEKLLETKTLFTDKEFPATLSSLFYSLTQYDIEQNEELVRIQWKRPSEICSNPYLFVNGVTSNDVLQGRLGNCWFVAACTCITVYRENWMMLIPDYKAQEWTKKRNSEYCGIFKFRFWRYGTWTEIIIDDFLPTLENDLIYCHSNYRNEFWSALLEKAYAKMLGSYEALEGGELIESLVDFTGGLAEPIILTSENGRVEVQNRLFQYLLKEHGFKSLIASAIPALTPEEQETETNLGLIIGHAYAITMVIEFPLDDAGTAEGSVSSVVSSRTHNNRIRMVRLKNPWGQGEWRGPFCDESPEWQYISKSSRHRVGLTFQDDGEFWMPFVDFVSNFSSLVICHQINNIFNKLFYETVFHGAWSGNFTGGCLNFKNSFLNNPQYVFDVESSDEEEIMMCLTQKMIRETNRNAGATGLLHIGYSVLKIEANRQYRVHRLDHCLLEQSSSFKNGRSIFLRITLKRGRYLIVPCTFQPGLKQSFMLRIYSKSKLNAHMCRELTDITPYTGLVSWVNKASEVASRITVYKATGLPRIDPIDGANPYFVLICENQRCVSSIFTRSLDPEWDESFIFYRKSPNKEPIVILVYSRCGVLDEFIGRQIISGVSRDDNHILEFELTGRHGDTPSKGTIFIQHKTFSSNEYDKL